MYDPCMDIKQFARLGGLARKKKISPQRRREISRIANEAKAKFNRAKCPKAEK